LPPADSTTGRSFPKALPRPELSIQQNPTGYKARFVPSAWHQTSFTRPAASPPLIRGSPSIYQPRPASSTPRLQAFSRFRKPRPAPNSFNLLGFADFVKRRFFQTFPSAAPAPPFRRQPYKVHHLPPPRQPPVAIASASLRAGFLGGRQVYTPPSSRSRALFRARHGQGTIRMLSQPHSRAENAGVAEGRGGTHRGGGKRCEGPRAVGWCSQRGLRETRAGGNMRFRKDVRARGSRSGRGDPAGAAHGRGGLGQKRDAPRRLAAPAEETDGTTAVPLARPAPERSPHPARP